MKREKIIINDLLKVAGITLNGSQPYDLHVHNEKLYERILQRGSLGLGEAYMDGWWDCEQLDIFFHKLFSAKLEKKSKNKFKHSV